MKAAIPVPLYEVDIPSNPPIMFGADPHSGPDEQRAEERETFLCSPRAIPVLTREFDSLITQVVRQVTALDTEVVGAKPEVRRAPDRCIVQLGPFALTVSWLRSKANRVFDGRLLIMEWEGIVARGAECVPERTQNPLAGKSARMIREETLEASATGSEDWLWRKEGDTMGGQASRDLADFCVNSLASMVREHQQMEIDKQVA